MIRNYFKIGKNSNAQKFLKALKYEKTYDSDTREKNKRLMDGAMQAFAEGRPENVQTAIANGSDVQFHHYPALVANVLLKVTEKSNDKLAAVSLALNKSSDPQAKLDKALDKALSMNIGDRSFHALLLKAKVFEFEKLPVQNGEDILRGPLDTALRQRIGGEDFHASLLKAGLAKVPAADKERVLNDTLNVAVQQKAPETFLTLLLKLGAEANARIKGHSGSILVAATCNQSPISVIELLHKNGARFDDAETTMQSQGYNAEDISRLKFYQEKLEGGKPAAIAIQAAAQAVKKAATVAEPLAAEQGDVRDILLQILAQVKELTEYVKRDQPEAPASAQNKGRRRGNYPSL